MGFWHHLLPSLASVLLLATAGDALRRNLEESSFETVNVYEGSGRLRRSLRQATSKNRMAITVENKQRKWTLDLQRNSDLIAPQFVVRYFDGNGQEVIVRNGPQHHLQGKIRGLSDSIVAVSISDGMRGIVDDGETLFHIHPAAGDNEKSHILFTKQIFQGFPAKMTCGNGDNFGDGIVLPFQDKDGNHHHVNKRASYQYTVELAVIVDKGMFTQLKSIPAATNYVTEMVNVVDAVFKRMNIGVRIALTAIEIWTKEDRITPSKNAKTLLTRLIAYNKKLRAGRRIQADNIQLLSSTGFNGTIIGMAFPQTICAGDRSAGVNTVLSYDSPSFQAVLVAHEMGHSVGMSHDRTGCNCKDPIGCIMSANYDLTGGVRNYVFSECSRKDFEKTINQNLGSCLFNVPEDVFGGPICGNGYVEEGEECDCGTDEECVLDRCCNSCTCRLKDGAVCSDSDSDCCQKCQFSPVGKLCRAKLNDCDYAEYCTGTSAECPPNCYKADGTECMGATESYCFNGGCLTLTDQCKSLWGPDSTAAKDVCYEAYRRFQCTSTNDDGTNNPRCNPKNKLCGQLLCKTDRKWPIIGNALRTKNIKAGSIQCKSTEVSLGPDVPNPGVIRDGTKCGDGKICYSDECFNVTTVLKLLGSWPSNDKLCDSKTNQNGGTRPQPITPRPGPETTRGGSRGWLATQPTLPGLVPGTTTSGTPVAESHGYNAGLIAGIVLPVIGIFVAIVILSFCFPHVFFRCCPSLLSKCLTKKSHSRKTSASGTNSINYENANKNKGITSVQVELPTARKSEGTSVSCPLPLPEGPSSAAKPNRTAAAAGRHPSHANHPLYVRGRPTQSQSNSNKMKVLKPPPPTPDKSRK